MPCRHSLVVSVTATFAMICGLAAAWGEQVIQLAGVRNVTATVSESDDTYRIAVEMLPVRAFDPATNKTLNVSKGRMYAAQALAKHLKAVDIAIKGLEVRESGTSGKFFRLVAVVPREGVSVGAIAASPGGVHHGDAGTASSLHYSLLTLPLHRHPTNNPRDA